MCLIWIEVRHLPIITPIQIHTWNSAKAAIVTTQIGKKFGEMQPSTWMICMGPINDNFISWWHLHMLITGEPDKCSETWDTAKEAESYLLCEWCVWPAVCIINVLNLVFSLRMSKCLAKVQDTAMPMFHCSPSQHFLQRQPSPAGLSYHFSQSVPSQNMFSVTCGFVWDSIILQPTLHSILQSGHLNW